MAANTPKRDRKPKSQATKAHNSINRNGNCLLLSGGQSVILSRDPVIRANETRVWSPKTRTIPGEWKRTMAVFVSGPGPSEQTNKLVHTTNGAI